MLADMSVNVLIAARHAATRAGIKAALERGGDRVVAECGDAADVADHALRARPDVCVVDLDLPGGGLTAVRAIAAQRRAPRILVLGSGARDDDVFAALRAGADGFVVKDVEPSRLAEQVAAVAAGDAVLSPNLMARLIAEFRAGERRATTRLLTLREEEALTLIGEGLTTKEVALRLSLAPTTVRRHLSTAAEKLGAGDRARRSSSSAPFKQVNANEPCGPFHEHAAAITLGSERDVVRPRRAVPSWSQTGCSQTEGNRRRRDETEVFEAAVHRRPGRRRGRDRKRGRARRRRRRRLHQRVLQGGERTASRHRRDRRLQSRGAADLLEPDGSAGTCGACGACGARGAEGRPGPARRDGARLPRVPAHPQRGRGDRGRRWADRLHLPGGKRPDADPHDDAAKRGICGQLVGRRAEGLRHRRLHLLGSQQRDRTERDSNGARSGGHARRATVASNGIFGIPTGGGTLTLECWQARNGSGEPTGESPTAFYNTLTATTLTGATLTRFPSGSTTELP